MLALPDRVYYIIEEIHGCKEDLDMVQVVTKDMIIADILAVDPGNAAILMAAGMHCIGCPASQGEPLEEACMVHGMDVDEVLEQINEYLAKKEQ